MKKKYLTEEQRKEKNRKRMEKWRRLHGVKPRKRFSSNEERLKEKKTYLKEYQKNNKNELRIKSKIYYHIHKDTIKEKNKKYTVLRKRTDINYKLAIILRSRLNKALRGNYKAGSAVRDLGCSIPELKIYLESKWKEGMNWQNYGKTGWYIDHIIPLISFDLTNREEFLKACHYTNLQPLWAEDNLIKWRHNNEDLQERILSMC